VRTRNKPGWEKGTAPTITIVWHWPAKSASAGVRPILGARCAQASDQRSAHTALISESVRRDKARSTLVAGLSLAGPRGRPAGQCHPFRRGQTLTRKAGLQFVSYTCNGGRRISSLRSQLRSLPRPREVSHLRPFETASTHLCPSANPAGQRLTNRRPRPRSSISASCRHPRADYRAPDRDAAQPRLGRYALPA
jgi:hypothetical protein